MWIQDQCGALRNLAHARDIVPCQVEGKWSVSITWIDAKPFHFIFPSEKERNDWLRHIRVKLMPEDFF